MLELGLGNGRTFDHLRELLPEREIFVFERSPDAHPDCLPDPAHLIVGDLVDELPRASALLPHRAALVHSDIGTGDGERNRRLAARLAELLPPLLAPAAIVISDQALPSARLSPLPLPSRHPARPLLYLSLHARPDSTARRPSAPPLADFCRILFG